MLQWFMHSVMPLQQRCNLKPFQIESQVSQILNQIMIF